MDYNINDITQYLTNFEDVIGDCFYEEITDDFIGEIDPGVDSFTYNTGISKCVIIPKKTDYVIKIPYTGYVEEEEYDTYYDFDCFKGWNSCAFERSIYKEAVENGFEEFFLKLTKVKEFSYYPVYIQPKAVLISDDIRDRYTKIPEVSPRVKNILKYKKIFRDGKMMDFWFGQIYAKLKSEDKFASFLQFLADRDLDKDLHYSNIGYYKDNPVIVDYAGFSVSKEDSSYYDQSL